MVFCRAVEAGVSDRCQVCIALIASGRGMREAICLAAMAEFLPSEAQLVAGILELVATGREAFVGDRQGCGRLAECLVVMLGRELGGDREGGEAGHREGAAESCCEGEDRAVATVIAKADRMWRKGFVEHGGLLSQAPCQAGIWALMARRGPTSVCGR